MPDIRSDFPIFEKFPNLVFLDSASTSQKPNFVINRVANYLKTGYANIHRGSYELSEISETLYKSSKVAVARLIGAKSHYEITYSNNATGAFNLLAASMAKSGWIKSGDRVLLSIMEHHANVVPWLMLRESHGIEVEFVGITADFELDLEDFMEKLTPNTRVISFTGCSNVTGTGVDFTQVASIISKCWLPDWGKPPFRVMDASQRIAHMPVDVIKNELDFAIFTGHKIWADTGIGVLWGKQELLKTLVPAIGGGGAINFVHTDGFEFSGLPYRLEPGTPNLTGAVSLLASVEYFESIGSYTFLEKHEAELVEFALEEFAKRVDRIRLFGPTQAVLPSGKLRSGVFAFEVAGHHMVDVADALAEKNVCVRAGHHCAEPLHLDKGVSGTVRMSISIYTTRADIEKFFEALDSLM